jgi:hypothetical protein
MEYTLAPSAPPLPANKYKESDETMVDFEDFVREWKEQRPLARFSKTAVTALGKVKKKVGL